MDQAQRAIWRAGLVAAYHGPPADPRFSAHGRPVIANSDMLWRSKLFVQHARAGADAGSAFAPRRPKACRAWRRRRRWHCPASAGRLSGAAEHGLSNGLRIEIERQILPDGGHVRPLAGRCCCMLTASHMVMDALTASDREPPHALRSALDRMAPMLRFFRHGDGALALFKGGQRRRAPHDRQSPVAGRSARPAFRPCAPFRLSAADSGHAAW